MIKKLIALGMIHCFLILVAVPFLVTAAEISLYVDGVNGNDSYAGSIDKPLQSISSARDKVRAMTKEQSGDITVYMREGTYFQEETLVFDEKDSGQNGFDIVYKAYEKEEVILSGGKPITGWEIYDEDLNIYRAPALGIDTRGITVNGIKAQRARSNVGLSNVEKYSNIGITTTDTHMKDWENITDVEFVFQNVWFNSRCGVAGVSLKGSVLQIEMDQPGWRYIATRGSYPVLEPEYIENAYELLDTPGEWYLNKSDDYFYYMPLKNEDMKTAQVYAWVLETLMSVKGSSLEERAHNIRFEDLSFRHVTYLRPNTKSGHSDAQNNYIRNQEGFRDYLIEASVEVEAAYHIPFTGCEFTQLGGLGLKMVDGVQYSDITGCHFHRISGGALAIGEASTGNPDYAIPPDQRLVMLSNNVRNNYIHHVAEDFRSATGISLGYVVDTEVAYNDIEELPYSGMHIGYGWDNYATVLSGLKVTRNYIQNVLNEKMHDGGGIYTNGHTGGTLSAMNIISENYIKNCQNDNAGIYHDSGSSFYLSERNVIDNYDYPDSPNGIVARNWLLPANLSYSLHYIDNWTVIPENSYVTNKFTNGVTKDLRIEGTKVVPDCMWDEDALSIIANAGMESMWKKRWGGIDKEALDKMIVDREIRMDLDEEVEIKPVILNNSGKLVEATISLDSKNPEIITVKDGKLYGKSRGIADVVVTADRGDGKPLRKEIKALVNDAITLVEILPNITTMYEGNRFLLKVDVQTVLGNTPKDIEIELKSHNPAIADINREGYLEAYSSGSCKIEAIVKNAEERFSEIIDIKVLPMSDSDGLEAAVRSGRLKTEMVHFNDVISDSDNWRLPASNVQGKITPGDGVVNVTTTGSSATGYGHYLGKKYQNEILNFNMRINNDTGWYAIALRNQTENSPAGTVAAGSSSYVIVFNPTTVELHRFNDGQRTVFYGDIGGFESKAGGAVPNRLTYNKEHRIQAGAINTDEGVLLILLVDDEIVFWYLDTYEEAIREPGYFAYIVRSGGTVDFINPTDTEFDLSGADDEEEVSLELSFNDVQNHWAKSEIAFLSQKGIFKGDENNNFNPEEQITRAQLITALIRTLGLRRTAYSGTLGDVNGTEWHAGYIQTALGNGFINAALLSGEDEISPNRPITREETAGIFAAALPDGIMDLNGAERFEDFDAVSHAYKRAVAEMISAGILTGQSETRIEPEKGLTRAEAAVILMRTYNDIKK